jgi:hypothetical protein
LAFTSSSLIEPPELLLAPVLVPLPVPAALVLPDGLPPPWPFPEDVPAAPLSQPRASMTKPTVSHEK